MKLVALGVVGLAAAAFVGFIGMMIATDESYAARPWFMTALVLFYLSLLTIAGGVIVRFVYGKKKKDGAG